MNNARKAVERLREFGRRKVISHGHWKDDMDRIDAALDERDRLREVLERVLIADGMESPEWQDYRAAVFSDARALLAQEKP